MRHLNRDKIVIARDAAGRWIISSDRDNQDNGTFIDFLQRRRSLSLSQVRQELCQGLPGGSGPMLLRSARIAGTTPTPGRR